jgi:ABC-type sugar transport system substrate-binding protein
MGSALVSGRIFTRKASMLAASSLLAVAGLAGCADAGSVEAGAGGADCIAAADEHMAAYRELPTRLPAGYTPLQAKPKAGTVIYVGFGAQPADADIGKGMEEAAASVGWDYSFISHDGTVEDINSKFMDAVNRRPTAIAWSGTPAAAIQEPLEAAAKAGIAVMAAAVPDQPTGIPGFAGVTSDALEYSRIGEVTANWVMADSGCSAKAVIVGLPYPVLQAQATSFVDTLKNGCEACDATYIEVQGKDVGTPAATNAIISAIQSDPSIRYVSINVGVLATGVREALAAVGLNDVVVFGLSPDANAIKALQDGKDAMWLGGSSRALGYELFDGVLRIQDSGEVFTGLPKLVSLLTPENVPTDVTDAVAYPLDFDKQFHALWHVG